VQRILSNSPSSEIVDQHVPCDNCGSSDARCNYSDGHGYCFSCSYYYPPDKEFDIISDDIFTYEYLPHRGLERGTFEFYGSKTKIDAAGKPRSIGFPYPNGSFKVRELAAKTFYAKGDIAKAGLFGRNLFAPGSHKYVTITEGELDALSVYQVLRSPCVSVRSSVTAVSDCTIDRSWLNSFERIYICFDADEPGRDAAALVAKLFDYNKVYFVGLAGGDRKDANDYVRAGEADELKNIWWNSKRYQPDSIKSDLSYFKSLVVEKPQWGLSFPWPSITAATYGIRKKESVLITALEGVGKTEICHAVEHSILKNTSDNVGAIYIEEPEKRHLEALAGLELRQPVHLPDRSATDGDVSEALQKVIGKDDRLFLYSHFGSDDPDTILDTIRFLVTARLCKYIILDHISMVVSGLKSRDATQALDYLSTRLQMMLMELDFALILVSHVNDDLLTRGSRNISKVGNTWLHLSRDLKSDDPVEVRTTQVSLFKNRYAWKTGPICKLLFDPVTYTLSELEPANDNQEPRHELWA
jgi:twinkle protein